MWRVTLNYYRGILVSALSLNLVIVYIFHDVDQDLVGKWNKAFEYLAVETLIWAFLIALATLLLTQAGRIVIGLRPGVPPSKLGTAVGLVVGFTQYIWDFLMRKLTDQHNDLWLFVFMLLAAFTSAAIFVSACRKPKPVIPVG